MKKSAYKQFFKALANDTRLAILAELKKKPRSVGDIAITTGFEQSRISHNLKILETWGFISATRDGKKRIYALDDVHVRPLLEDIDDYMKTYEKRLCTCGILAGKKTCPHMKSEKR